MHLMRAFTVMLGDVTAADASARQVKGILAWREQVDTALDRASDSAGTSVRAVPPSGTHRSWRAASAVILDALTTQAQHAAVLCAEAERQEAEALEAEKAALRAAAAAGKAAEAEAAAARRCASGDEEGQAADHQAAAVRLRQEAADHQAAASRHREAAAAARKQRDDAIRWTVAAWDARDAGAALVRQENVIAIAVGEAITAAGGISEVYGGKQSLTMGGAA